MLGISPGKSYCNSINVVNVFLQRCQNTIQTIFTTFFLLPLLQLYGQANLRAQITLKLSEKSGELSQGALNVLGRIGGDDLLVEF